MMNTSPYPRLLTLLCIGCCAGLLQIEPTAAQVTFTNVSEEMGVEIATSYGVRTTALGDYDNDAKLDAFIVGGARIGIFCAQQ